MCKDRPKLLLKMCNVLAKSLLKMCILCFSKAGKNVKAISLKNYLARHNPPYAIRFSERNFSRTGNLLNLPLYLVGRLPELLAQ
jgi:hypothetical protein